MEEEGGERQRGRLPDTREDDDKGKEEGDEEDVEYEGGRVGSDCRPVAVWVQYCLSLVWSTRDNRASHFQRKTKPTYFIVIR